MYLKIMKEYTTQEDPNIIRDDGLYTIIGEIRHFELFRNVCVNNDPNDKHNISNITTNFTNGFRNVKGKDVFDQVPIMSNVIKVTYMDGKTEPIFTNCQCYLVSSTGKTLQSINRI